KPLGTSLTMRPNDFAVNDLLCATSLFSSTSFSLSFQDVTELSCCKCCGKNVAPEFCLAILDGMRRLLIRPGAIGDFILSLPAMECLRDGYLEVWAAAANVPLARFADRACSIASTGLDLVGVTGAEPRLLDRL